MAAIAKVKVVETKASGSNTKSLSEVLTSKASGELVLLLAGPIGCGLDSVIERLKVKLFEFGYEAVYVVKLSEFLSDAIDTELVDKWQSSSGASRKFQRVRGLQEAGKSLRRRTSNPAILAEYAAEAIHVHRERHIKKAKDQDVAKSPAENDSQEESTKHTRIAYIIDQVKRPEEVALLRLIYRNICYLFGVTRISERRKDALVADGAREAEALELMEIDKAEGGKDGQQLDKTLQLSDFFVRNDASTVDDQSKKLVRFLRLIHGDKTVTPSDVERGMFAAYTAGLRSACLSRQVGAAITQADGQIISTGCNDVPRAGGGLYSESSSGPDLRCFNKVEQHCFNDIHKSKMFGQIGDLIEGALAGLREGDQSIHLTVDEKGLLLKSIRENSSIKGLIEFSRAVHAEMDAIVSLARVGGVGLGGSTLYTTTFPCHSCARHIVAAGILKVYYIEPYEGSLAKELHGDSIRFDVEETSPGLAGRDMPPRVEFLHFEGVAPRQYGTLFRAVRRKNESGHLVAIELRSADQVLAEYTEDYLKFELRAMHQFNEDKLKAKKS